MLKNRMKKHEKNHNTIIEEDLKENNDTKIQEENDSCQTKYNKNKIIFEHCYNFSISTLNFLLKTVLVLLKASGIYLLWICLHYFSAHLYVKFCVPDTIIGFLMSPFMIATPHCQGLRWIVYNAAGIINNMWIFIGAWIYSIIWIFNKETNVESASL